MPTVFIDSTVDAWQDTGLTLPVGQELAVSASGEVDWGGGTSTPAGNPGSGFPSPLPGVPVFGLAILLLSVGETPPAPPLADEPPITGNVFGPGESDLITLVDLTGLTDPGPWRVWARINDTVVGDNSGSWEVTVTAQDPPAPPDAPVLTGAVYDEEAGSVALTAEPVSGAGSYRWYRAQGAQPPHLIGSSAGSTFTDTDPPPGATLTYYVIAVNVAGSSGPSNSLLVSTLSDSEEPIPMRHKNLRGIQVGVESALGSPVQAAQKLFAVTLDPQPVTPRSERRARGIKAPVGHIRQKGEHSTSPIGGFLAINELLFLAAAHWCAPVVSTPAGATAARDWTYKPSATNADTIRSLTCEVGSDEGASRFAGGRVPSLELTMSNDDMTLGGEMIGQVLAEYGVVLTSNPTNVPLVMLHADSWEVYVTDALANLADEDLSPYRLSRCMEFSLASDGRGNPRFFGDRSNRSYSGVLEGETAITGSIDVAQDATADQAIMTALRGVETRYCRVIALGPIIETGFRHQLQLTFPFEYVNPARGDDDNLHTGEYDLRAKFDATFGGFFEMVIRTNQVSTLLDADTALASGQHPNTLVADLYA